MGDLSTMVQVADLERLVKRVMLSDQPCLQSDSDTLAAFYRLCAAIVTARDHAEAALPKVFKFTLPVGAGYDKINAIKLVRQIFGYGLKEAKDAVDANTLFELPLHREQEFKGTAKAYGVHYIVSPQY